MRPHLLLLTAALVMGAMTPQNAAAANWTVEWDAPPAGTGTLQYIVQEKQSDGSWLDKATTSALIVTFTVTPPAGTEYRLKIRNVNTLEESIDPNIVTPVPPDLPPPATLNFRLKITQAAIENATQMLAYLRVRERWFAFLPQAPAPELIAQLQ